MFLHITLQLIAITLCYMTSLFIIALIKKDNSIVDIGWGIGFIILTCFSFLKYGNYAHRQTITTLLVLLWGVRIASYIFIKNFGKEEDVRYATWRKQWKWVKLRSFLQVFMLQGAIMLIICSPALLINITPNIPLHLLDYCAIGLWIIGFYFQGVADLQLLRFLQTRTDQKKILNTGLWKYSRHPNYFGEFCMWSGIFLLALSVGYGIYTIVSPLILLYIFFDISIPITEKHMEHIPAFKKYQKTTSKFFPWI